MAKATIGLIFRPASLGGKSVEEIFSGLLSYWNGKLDIETYADDLNRTARQQGRQLKKKAFTLNHFTGGAHRLLYFIRGRTILLTIHDIGRLKELKGVRRAGYYVLVLYLPLRIATRITTVSEFSKNDLLTHFPFLQKKGVHVIHNPLPTRFRPYHKHFNSQQPRILQIGTQPHKNNVRVIQALKDIPCIVVLVGKLTEVIQHALRENKVQYESYPELTYEMVYEQYCQSDLLVFASLHEGFGMPIIEAQAVGRPVIASNIPPHTEIAGDSVKYVNPESITEIREAIKEFLESSSLREEFVAKGNTNSKRFQLDAIAEQYEAVYTEMIAIAKQLK
jgi:glycosyltransferase involved in cell wall biosynthesis